ncbi:MAG TPA: hypothetical protein VH643_11945 [Gemmataceae bacterium]|jgi:hypothetical protein
MDCGRRAARAWRPGELLRMEDVSLAFHFVEQQRHRGILVEPIHIDRLVETLFRYFDYRGEARTRVELRRMVNDYLDEHSAPDAELAPGEFGSVRVSHHLLDQLRELHAEMEARFPDRLGMAGLAGVGLILDYELDQSRYDHCTPHNCRTFAHTGCDGDHFSLLVQAGSITEDSPVILTAPSCFQVNVIVGETLFDFLCLGVRRGYFDLRELTHRPEEALPKYLAPGQEMQSLQQEEGDDPAFEAFQRQVLGYLSAALGLHPWTNMEKFHRLQERYRSCLKLPPDLRHCD